MHFCYSDCKPMFLLRSRFQPESSPMVQGFNLLRLLNLENNCIAEWSEILKLGQLRRYRFYYFVLQLGQLVVDEPWLISPYFLGTFDCAISLEQIQLNNNKLGRIFYPSLDGLHELFGDVESQGDFSPFQNLRYLLLGRLSRSFNSWYLFIDCFK